jgi:hypothetical protein
VCRRRFRILFLQCRLVFFVTHTHTVLDIRPLPDTLDIPLPDTRPVLGQGHKRHHFFLTQKRMLSWISWPPTSKLLRRKASAHQQHTYFELNKNQVDNFLKNIKIIIY